MNEQCRCVRVACVRVSRSQLAGAAALAGGVTFAKDELGRKVDSYGLHVLLPEPPKRAPAPKDKARPNDDYMDALKDFCTGWLAKLGQYTTRGQLYQLQNNHSVIR